MCSVKASSLVALSRPALAEVSGRAHAERTRRAHCGLQEWLHGGAQWQTERAGVVNAGATVLGTNKGLYAEHLIWAACGETTRVEVVVHGAMQF